MLSLFHAVVFWISISSSVAIFGYQEINPVLYPSVMHCCVGIVHHNRLYEVLGDLQAHVS